VGGVKTRYVYDGEDIALEFDGNNALVARYSHGDEVDQPLAVERGGQRFFYHANHQGSVRQLTDATGAVVNQYDYDAYGFATTDVETVPQPFGYTGRERDRETGLLHYRARAYDPRIGKFLQNDPIGFEAGDLNLTNYVFNRPTMLTDPMGLSAAGESAATTGPAAGAATTLGRVANGIACTLNILATGLEVANSGDVITGIQSAQDNWRDCQSVGNPMEVLQAGCRVGAALSSFSAGTLVETPYGPRRIESLRIGDLVMARDDRTGETRPQRVTDLLQHMATEGVIRLTLQRVPDPRQTLLLVSSAGTETLSVTASHPVRVAGRGWVPAGDLRPGDRVEAREGLLQVLATGVDLQVQPVYNLSVENAEAYFVGDLGAWVHNSRKGPVPTPPFPGAVGPHSVKKPDGTGWLTYEPNPRHPNGWELVERVDLCGGAHRGKDGIPVPTPHKHNRDGTVAPLR
jgi:RHS repeat-associated protein